MREQREDDVVLLGEFARLAGVSRMTAYVWARAGDLPARWRGGRYELDRHSVGRILAKLRRDGRIPAVSEVPQVA